MCDLLPFDDIEKLFNTYQIGTVIEKPVSISGGLMHKMYRVTTNTKDYAVKCVFCTTYIE